MFLQSWMKMQDFSQRLNMLRMRATGCHPDDREIIDRPKGNRVFSLAGTSKMQDGFSTSCIRQSIMSVDTQEDFDNRMSPFSFCPQKLPVSPQTGWTDDEILHYPTPPGMIKSFFVRPGSRQRGLYEFQRPSWRGPARGFGLDQHSVRAGIHFPE